MCQQIDAIANDLRFGRNVHGRDTGIAIKKCLAPLLHSIQHDHCGERAVIARLACVYLKPRTNVVHLSGAQQSGFELSGPGYKWLKDFMRCCEERGMLHAIASVRVHVPTRDTRDTRLTCLLKRAVVRTSALMSLLI